jgi:hypothetical protein
MKLDEAQGIFAYWELVYGNPRILTSLDWQGAKGQLKEACRILNDPSVIEKINRMINELEKRFGKA